MTKLTLVVLAAGIGSRYKGLKQLDPVGPSGETIIDYSLSDALKAGFQKIVFVIRKDIEEDFRRVIGNYWEKKTETDYVFQDLVSFLPPFFSPPSSRVKPWGTGHAVLNCRNAVDSPFAVINADDFYGLSAFSNVGKFLISPISSLGQADEYCFAGYRLRNTLSEFGPVSRGVCSVDEDGTLRDIAEIVKIVKDGEAAKTAGPDGKWLRLTGDEIVSMNLWGFSPTFFSLLEEEFLSFIKDVGHDPKAEFYIPIAVCGLIKTGKARVKCLPTAEKWLGVTYQEDIPGVASGLQELIKDGRYPEKLRS